jgi:hypothetical protein
LAGGVPVPDATYTSRLSLNDTTIFWSTVFDKSVSATGTYAYTGTMSTANYSAIIVTIKNPGGGGAVTCTRGLLGVGCDLLGDPPRETAPERLETSAAADPGVGLQRQPVFVPAPCERCVHQMHHNTP